MVPAPAAAAAAPGGSTPPATPAACTVPAMSSPGFAAPSQTALFSGGELTVDWPVARVIAGGGMLADEIASAPVVLADSTLDRLIVAAGERDLIAGASAAEAGASYDRLVQAIQSPRRQLVLLQLPHLFGTYAALNPQVDLFNQHLCTLAQPGSVWVLDLTSAMADQADFTGQSGYLEPSLAGNQLLVRAYAGVNQ
ncbi:hypothetical protein SAMN05421770_101605 [Granulicella rosea]|uniref:GDSL-like Lipase/Acylhydrolase family protein n=2 Tax=Granulicella rosea TaxID=474952 RepID=A0A239DSW5_9BACT|nr:hypothetical protein SAMN05421770_101605 [Granulicella rosea]